MTKLKQKVVEYNEMVAASSKERPGSYRIIGVGLDNAEVGFPPSLFKDIYAFAVKHDLLPVAHAGEEADPDYIWQAIKQLGMVFFFVSLLIVLYAV